MPAAVATHAQIGQLALATLACKGGLDIHHFKRQNLACKDNFLAVERQAAKNDLQLATGKVLLALRG